MNLLLSPEARRIQTQLRIWDLEKKMDLQPSSSLFYDYDAVLDNYHSSHQLNDRLGIEIRRRVSKVIGVVGAFGTLLIWSWAAIWLWWALATTNFDHASGQNVMALMFLIFFAPVLTALWWVYMVQLNGTLYKKAYTLSR